MNHFSLCRVRQTFAAREVEPPRLCSQVEPGNEKQRLRLLVQDFIEKNLWINQIFFRDFTEASRSQ